MIECIPSPSQPPALYKLIGNTPLVEVTRLDTGPCQLFLKLESQNPGGSIKDRIGLSIIEAAEADGRLQPGGTIIEATAGNTGIGLALVGRIKGYRVILVVPDKMSTEKVLHLKALGAEVHTTRSDVGKGHPEYYQDYAARLARELPGAFFADQFNNPANPLAHETTTGPGNLGAKRARRGRHRRRRRLVRHPDGPDALLPQGAAASWNSCWPTRKAPSSPNTSIRAKCRDTSGSWAVEGIGEDFIPSIADMDSVTTGLHHHRPGKLRQRARPAARRRHPRRLVDRHPAGRRPQVLPRTDHAQARRHVCLRHGHALPVEGLQRRLDARPGLVAAGRCRATCAT